ncbi:Hypothetical protein HVR_LOCUS1125 [uncultured virus]|nr:Hypothetical protein HVR_LOCUS1125 [uncultured virus]
MPGKRYYILEHNRIVNNSNSLLKSEEKIQKVEVEGIEYVAIREHQNILSKITGSVMDTKPVAIIIARLENNKIIPLKSGCSLKNNYFIRTGILEQDETSVDYFSNHVILKQLQDTGFDVSDIQVIRYIIDDILDNMLANISD